MKSAAVFLSIILIGFIFGTLFGSVRSYKKASPSVSEAGLGSSNSREKQTSDNALRIPTQNPHLLIAAPGPSAALPSATWVPQTFNNCVPATTSMLLQHFGRTVSQIQIKEDLRTNPDDKNVFFSEMSEYLNTNYGVESKVLFNGTIEKLKILVANGVYIVLENWLHPNEDIGHAVLLTGYDDSKGVLIADDSYLGVGIKIPYDTFSDQQWKAFNWEYMPVYSKDKEELVKAIIGDEWNDRIMHENAIARNKVLVGTDKHDMYAWFNMGVSYYSLGKFPDAKNAFENAQDIGWPKRMLWYQIQPIQTYNILGEHTKALELVKEALRYNNSFAEAHLEAAIAYKGLGNIVLAKKEAETALEFAPALQRAHAFLSSL